jgi:hypothetical protein
MSRLLPLKAGSGTSESRRDSKAQTGILHSGRAPHGPGRLLLLAKGIGRRISPAIVPSAPLGAQRLGLK